MASKNKATPASLASTPDLCMAVAVKAIPSSNWHIVKTSNQREFYWNSVTDTVSWCIPSAIQRRLAQLLPWSVSLLPGLSKDDSNPVVESKTIIYTSTSAAKDEEFKTINKRYLSPTQEEVSPTEEDSSKRLKVNDSIIQIEDTSEPAQQTRDPLLSRADQEMDFLEILNQINPSPFAIFELEQEKWIHGYMGLQVTLPETAQRTLFDDYCAAATEFYQAEAPPPPQKTSFEELLDELQKPDMFYDEFCRKFRKDPRFASLTDLKERARLFKNRISDLKEQKKGKGQLKFISSNEGDKKAMSDAVKERQLKIMQERNRMEQERMLQRNRLDHASLSIAFNDFLAIHVKHHTMDWPSLLSFVDPTKMPLPESELRKHFESHCDRLFERRCTEFSDFIRSRFPVSMSWSDVTSSPGFDMCMQSQACRSLALNETEVGKLFTRVQQHRKREEIDQFQALLRESPFLLYHVRNAIFAAQASSSRALKKDAAEKLLTFAGDDEDDESSGAELFGSEGKFISIKDINAVLCQDARFRDSRLFQDLLIGHIRELIKQVKQEKGGTLDKTIAEHA